MKNIGDIAEEIVKEINQDTFLKEFTFSNNRIKGSDSDELADSIVWIDDILFLIQIKLREAKSQGDIEQERKWFDNKVIKKAKEQIKNTLSYFEKYDTLPLANGRGFTADLKKAPLLNSKKIILYYPGTNLGAEERFRKFYFSKEAGFIHLLHLEDYQWLCKYLITPFELDEYLNHRENISNELGVAVNKLPEQLLLGHYLSGDNVKNIGKDHIKYFYDFDYTSKDFDISGLTELFFERQRVPVEQYHIILKELAKLHRAELKEFKKRFILSLEKIKEDEYTRPYRITIPRTGCGFVFIPLPKELSKNWEVALKNLTLAHQYDQKADRCIGITFVSLSEPKGFIDINWLFSEHTWQKDEDYEKELYANFPFREVSTNKIYRYNF